MIARSTAIALLLITAALLQTALFPYLALAGYRPDLLLLIVAAFSLREGPTVGVRVGFAAGLITDLLLNHSAIGLTALVFVGVGYVVGVARPYVAPNSLTAPLLLAFATGLLGTAGYGGLSRLLGDERFTLELVTQTSIFVAVYNLLLAPVVFQIVNRMVDRFPAPSVVATR